MSFGFGLSLPAYPLRGGGGNNPFNQLGPTLDLAFAGIPTDPLGAATLTDYTLNTNFIVPQYQIAAQYVVWENGVGLVNKNFSDIITFTRASTATYFDSSGVLQTAGNNVPRLDYDPATLAARGLLVEEQRTNSLPRSEEFSDASWLKGGATVTADSTTAPSGTTTADTLTEDTSTGQHRVFRTVSGTTNTNPYTVTFFAEANTRTRVYVGINESPTFGRNGNAVFDLSAGTIVFANTGSGGATGGSATIQNVGNGWYRCSYTLTLGGTDTSIFCDINLVSTGTTVNYTGNGTGAIFLWGAQLEAGAFPTSYIPTTTTALTRSADVANVNTLAPWYNAAASTIYAEWTNLAATMPSGGIQTVSNINDTTGNNQQSLFQIQAASSKASANMFSGGVNAGRIDAGGAYSNATVKAASAYAALDRAISVNGGSAVTSAVGALPTSVTRLELGSAFLANYLNGYLRRVTYYPRRLSNAELVSITS